MTLTSLTLRAFTHLLLVGPGALVELCPGLSVPAVVRLQLGHCHVCALLSTLVIWILTHGLTSWLDPVLPHHHKLVWRSGHALVTLFRFCGWRGPCPADFHIRLSSQSFMGTTGSYCSLTGRGSALQTGEIQKRGFWVARNLLQVCMGLLLLRERSLLKPTLLLFLPSKEPLMIFEIWNLCIFCLLIFFIPWIRNRFLCWNWLVGLIGYSCLLNLQAFTGYFHMVLFRAVNRYLHLWAR